MNTTIIENFTRAGMALVPIPPINGSPAKGPRINGWNMPRSAKNPDGYSANFADFTRYGEGYNFGLFHGASGTLALDLDDLAIAKKVFEELTDIQLLDWLENEHRAEVRSPKPNRAKLIFKLPSDFADTNLRKLRKPDGDGNVFELRCGSNQDVIVGQHPEGGAYQFIGDPASIPDVPPVLLDMLKNWDDWKPCFDDALGINQAHPKDAPRKPQQGEHLPGWRNPIQEFNQSFSVIEILIRNGYKPKGRDRFIRPGSESKAPGVAIMRNCKDGIERVFSHGGDALNDGFAHDAFDCYMILECNGDWTKALNWNPDITKHNQRQYQQERAKNASEEPQGADEKQEQGKRTEWQPFPFIRANELTAKPAHTDWLIESIIERGSLNLLFGEPGAGKSLFALDWAFCIAAGIEWHGCRTKPVGVVVIAGEGHAGMGRRLKALEAKYGQKAPSGLFVSQKPAQLLDEKNAQWIADTVKGLCSDPGLVIVDTLHRNMDGDENSSQDIGKFIANLDGFIKPLGAAVLVVHHSGHGQKDRSRGSSSIRAAMDAEFSATKDGESVILSCHKAKDFEALKPLQFSIKTAELEWLDSDGQQMMSVYLEHEGDAKPSVKKRKLNARDDAILTSLSDAIAAHGVEPTAEIRAKFGGFDTLVGRHQKIVSIEHWRDFAYKATVVDANTEDAKRKAFKRCRDKLLEGRFTVEFDNYAWRIFE